MNWICAGSINEIKDGKGKILRSGSKQIALLNAEGDIYALDNRCPHEGYPLLEGSVKDCVLTCKWHNWKFDLKSGTCVVGQDHARVYPVKVEEGKVYVDASDPSPDKVKAKIMEDLREAFEKRSLGRLYRELARLHFNGLDMAETLPAALEWHHDRLEFGIGHAMAGAADWMQIHDGHPGDLGIRVSALGEALDYLAYDVLRHKQYPYTTNTLPWNEKEFLNAIENEEEARACAILNGALREGGIAGDLHAAFSKAALAHYNDFGHSAIYTYKIQQLIRRFGERLGKFLYPALLRSIIYSTREDVLPEFSKYSSYLKNWPEQSPDTGPVENTNELFGKSINACMEWTLEAAGKHSPMEVYDALLIAAARQLLYVDEKYFWETDVPPSDNINWLDFTHMVTFANALRQLCATQPWLWPQSLLQIACFVGRNAKYGDLKQDLTKWTVGDENAFYAECVDFLTDHGQSAHIFYVHMLKTFVAVREECGKAGLECKALLLAALNRFLHTPTKTKQVRRMVKQGIKLVEKDFL